MRAYYYTFEPTGCDEVDAILEAIAMAGKGYHSTADWGDAEQHGEDGYWSLIQRRCNQVAQTLRARGVEG